MSYQSKNCIFSCISLFIRRSVHHCVKSSCQRNQYPPSQRFYPPPTRPSCRWEHRPHSRRLLGLRRLPRFGGSRSTQLDNHPPIHRGRHYAEKAWKTFPVIIIIMVTCFARVISAGLPNAICRRTWRKTRWPAGDDDGDGDGDDGGDDDGDDDGDGANGETKTQYICWKIYMMYFEISMIAFQSKKLCQRIISIWCRHQEQHSFEMIIASSNQEQHSLSSSNLFARAWLCSNLRGLQKHKTA